MKSKLNKSRYCNLHKPQSFTDAGKGNRILVSNLNKKGEKTMGIKKRLKTTLAILMSLVLLSAAFPITAAATDGDEAVCKIGDTPYTSIADAVANATDGAVIDVISDTTISAAITVEKKITLTSSNGSTISTGTKNALTVGTLDEGKNPVTSGELTVSGDLKIISSASEAINLKYGKVTTKDNVEIAATLDTINIGTNAVPTTTVTELVIEGGTIASTTEDNATKSAVFIGTRATKVTISGGLIKGQKNGALRNKAKDSVITMTGGEISAKSQTVYYYDVVGGTFNMTGGTVRTTEGNQCFYFYNGTNKVTLNISGGELVSAKENALYYYKALGGVDTIITGGNITAKANTISVDSAKQKIDISGGTVTATEYTALKATATVQDTTVTISDTATLTSPKTTVRLNNPMFKVNITGGTVIATNTTPIKLELGTLNVTGGKIILNSSSEEAFVIDSSYDAESELSATANIKGGLFINENTANTALFNIAENAEPINYEAGKLMYTSNITNIIKGGLKAPKNAEAVYDWNGNKEADAGETYYIYNRFAGAEETYAGAMLDGATVRLVENSSGLRFTTDFSKDVVDALAAKGTVTYGTIIVPTEYLTSLDSFTVAALTAKYGENGYLNILCEDGKGLIANDDGSISIQAAIVNIKEENYSTAFSAVAYACVNGEYFYTAFDQSVNAATVKDVAAAALADTEATYTDAQTAILNGYVA